MVTESMSLIFWDISDLAVVEPKGAVANAMLSIAKAGEKGVYYYENDQILAFWILVFSI